MSGTLACSHHDVAEELLALFALIKRRQEARHLQQLSCNSTVPAIIHHMYLQCSLAELLNAHIERIMVTNRCHVLLTQQHSKQCMLA